MKVRCLPLDEKSSPIASASVLLPAHVLISYLPPNDCSPVRLYSGGSPSLRSSCRGPQNPVCKPTFVRTANIHAGRAFCSASIGVNLDEARNAIAAWRRGISGVDVLVGSRRLHPRRPLASQVVRNGFNLPSQIGNLCRILVRLESVLNGVCKVQMRQRCVVCAPRLIPQRKLPWDVRSRAGRAECFRPLF
eukprot:890356-Rhodomonas_salina.2